MNRAMRTLGAVVTAGATLMLAACTSGTGNPTTPATSDTASPTSASSGSAMPALDAEPYRSKPCDLLPADFLSSAGYTAPGNADTTSQTSKTFSGQACNWHSGTKTIHVQIALKNGNPPGIAKTLLQHDRGILAYAEPTDVSGYPSAYAGLTDLRSRGDCSLSVAVSDDVSLGFEAAGYGGEQQSCDLVKQMAEATIKTLQVS